MVFSTTPGPLRPLYRCAARDASNTDTHTRTAIAHAGTRSGALTVLIFFIARDIRKKAATRKWSREEAPRRAENLDPIAGNGGSRAHGRVSQVRARAQEGWVLDECEPGASINLARTFS